jgi:radical SAM protein with 4Fe4S-binding SPASM domain
MDLRETLTKAAVAAKSLRTGRLQLMVDLVPFDFHNVPTKKLLNFSAVGASAWLKPSRPWGWPTNLQVEPSTICNLRCALCPVTEGMARPTGLMEFPVFKKFIDEAGEYLFIMLFWDWGEPFLNPAIYDMISYAGSRGIQAISSTNGHVFANERQAEKLVESGLDAIIFAIDGITQETYARYRQGGDLETVLAGLRNVVAAKRRLRSPTPRIHVRFIVMHHNEHEIERMKNLAKQEGADIFTVKTLNPHGEFMSDVDCQAFLPRDKTWQRFKYDPVTLSRHRRVHNPCKAMWNTAILHWDGQVSTCTFDPHGRLALGDLKTQSFKDIWQGERFRRLRRQFRRNYQELEQCSQCTYGFVGGSLSSESIAKAFFFDQAII